jgi:hypothetical protein
MSYPFPNYETSKTKPVSKPAPRLKAPLEEILYNVGSVVVPVVGVLVLLVVESYKALFKKKED